MLGVQGFGEKGGVGHTLSRSTSIQPSVGSSRGFLEDSESKRNPCRNILDNELIVVAMLYRSLIHMRSSSPQKAAALTNCAAGVGGSGSINVVIKVKVMIA